LSIVGVLIYQITNQSIIMIALGKRKTQKNHGSRVVTIPSIWIYQHDPTEVETVHFFMDPNGDLIVRASKHEQGVEAQ